MLKGNSRAWLLSALLLLSLPLFGTASAQIVQPIPKSLIKSPTKKVEVFSMGYGAGVANYMCFEGLKQNLSLPAGKEILSNYKRWLAQQQTVKTSFFRQGFNQEVVQFNQAFPNNPCRFKL